MTLMNWDPWRDLADIRSIYNRVFGEGSGRACPATPSLALQAGTCRWTWPRPPTSTC